MRAVFASFNQAHYNDVLAILDKMKVRGFTAWNPVLGRGSQDGDPHYGDHAWPVMNIAVMAVVEDETADRLLEELHELDEMFNKLGLRAFSWNVDKMV